MKEETRRGNSMAMALFLRQYNTMCSLHFLSLNLLLFYSFSMEGSLFSLLQPSFLFFTSSFSCVLSSHSVYILFLLCLFLSFMHVSLFKFLRFWFRSMKYPSILFLIKREEREKQTYPWMTWCLLILSWHKKDLRGCSEGTFLPVSLCRSFVSHEWIEFNVNGIQKEYCHE